MANDWLAAAPRDCLQSVHRCVGPILTCGVIETLSESWIEHDPEQSSHGIMQSGLEDWIVRACRKGSSPRIALVPFHYEAKYGKTSSETIFTILMIDLGAEQVRVCSDKRTAPIA
jgi:hypothetical protein